LVELPPKQIYLGSPAGDLHVVSGAAEQLQRDAVLVGELSQEFVSRLRVQPVGRVLVQVDDRVLPGAVVGGAVRQSAAAQQRRDDRILGRVIGVGGSRALEAEVSFGGAVVAEFTWIRFRRNTRIAENLRRNQSEIKNFIETRRKIRGSLGFLNIG